MNIERSQVPRTQATKAVRVAWVLYASVADLRLILASTDAGVGTADQLSDEQLALAIRQASSRCRSSGCRRAYSSTARFSSGKASYGCTGRTGASGKGRTHFSSFNQR